MIGAMFTYDRPLPTKGVHWASLSARAIAYYFDAGARNNDARLADKVMAEVMRRVPAERDEFKHQLRLLREQ